MYLSKRLFLFTLLCGTFLGFSGCVPNVGKAIPLSDSRIQTELEKNRADFTTTPWVREWWRGYGDAQLTTLVENALKDAPRIQSLEAKFAQANTIIQSVQSRNLPHLSTHATVLHERFSENHIFPAPLGGGTYTQYEPELKLDYDFDFWHARSSQILAVTNEAFAQRASLEAAKVALSGALCETYLSWSYDEKKLIVLNTLEQNTRETLRIIEKQYALGLVDPMQINTAKSTLFQLGQRKEELKRTIEGKKEALCVLGGLLPSYADTLKPPSIKKGFTPPLPKTIMLDFLSHRPDVAVAKYTALAKSHTIEHAKAQFYPNISLSGLIGFTSFSWIKLLDHSSYTPSTGMAFSLPLLDWGERNAVLSSSVSDYNRSVYEYNHVVINAANEVVVLLKQSKLLQSQRHLHDEEMGAKKANTTIARKKLTQGLSDKLPYLTAQKTVYEGEIDTLSLLETDTLLHLHLITALGGGYGTMEESHDSQ